jgi:hypothetical protein
MLVRFLPDQVAKHWEEIKGAIKISAMDLGEGPEELNKILDKILCGSMICWISVDSNTKQFDGVLTTTILENDIKECKNVLIYSLTSLGNTSIESWNEALKTLQEYTKGIGAKKLIAYSKEPLICRFVQSIGGNCDFRLLELPLL